MAVNNVERGMPFCGAVRCVIRDARGRLRRKSQTVGISNSIGNFVLCECIQLMTHIHDVCTVVDMRLETCIKAYKLLILLINKNKIASAYLR